MQYIGEVVFHNGRYPRTFPVRVEAPSWTGAVSRALRDGQAARRSAIGQREQIDLLRITLKRVPAAGQEQT